MPSPNNVTELVIFVGGAIVVVIICLIASRYTAFGKRLTGDWKPGPIDLSTVQLHKREKYLDPLARIKMVYVIPPALLVMLGLFIYYFLTKNTWQSGN